MRLRASESAPSRSRSELSVPARAALPRAISMVPIPGSKFAPARGALARVRNGATLSPAMRAKRGRAVGANDSQVLDAVVVPDPIDVVEDQAHPLPLPDLALSADLTDRLLDTFVVEPLFQVATAVARVHHQDFGKGLLTVAPPQPSDARRVRIEVIGGNSPLLHPPLESSRIAARGAFAESAQGLRP